MAKILKVGDHVSEGTFIAIDNNKVIGSISYYLLSDNVHIKIQGEKYDNDEIKMALNMHLEQYLSTNYLGCILVRQSNNVDLSKATKEGWEVEQVYVLKKQI